MSPFDRQARIYALKIPRVLKDVLLCLSYHANGKDECFPGLRLISKESGVAYRHVRSGIAELQRLGLLAVIPGNPHRSTRYILKLPAVGKGESLGDSLRNPRGLRTVKEQTKRNASPWIECVACRKRIKHHIEHRCPKCWGVMQAYKEAAKINDAR